MVKTVHVFPENRQWAVKWEGAGAALEFSTQREAVKNARVIAKKGNSGQLVVHGLNGRIREYAAYGIPKIKDPRGKRSARIERAVTKMTLERLRAEPFPSRG